MIELILLSLVGEEGADEGGTFVGKHSRCDCSLFVEWRFAECVVSALVVGSSIHYAAYLAPTEGPGTHEARLYGDVERAVSEIFSSKIIGSRCYGLHFGMCGDIGQCFGEVVAARYYLSAAHYNCTDRHFIAFGSRFGFVESGKHKFLVLVSWGYLDGVLHKGLCVQIYCNTTFFTTLPQRTIYRCPVGSPVISVSEAAQR